MPLNLRWPEKCDRPTFQFVDCLSFGAELPQSTFSPLLWPNVEPLENLRLVWALLGELDRYFDHSENCLAFLWN